MIVKKKFKELVYQLYEIRKVGFSSIAVPPEGVPGFVPALENQIRTVRMHSADNNIEELLPRRIRVNRVERTNSAGRVPSELLDDILAFVRQLLGLGDNVNCKEESLPGACPTLDEMFKIDSIGDIINILKDIKGYFRGIYCRLEEIRNDLVAPQEVSVSCYQETLERTRDWYLSGSVFRRISNQVPRIKARLWMDALRGDVGRQGKICTKRKCRMPAYV